MENYQKYIMQVCTENSFMNIPGDFGGNAHRATR